MAYKFNIYTRKFDLVTEIPAEIPAQIATLQAENTAQSEKISALEEELKKFSQPEMISYSGERAPATTDVINIDLEKNANYSFFVEANGPWNKNFQINFQNSKKMPYGAERTIYITNSATPSTGHKPQFNVENENLMHCFGEIPADGSVWKITKTKIDESDYFMICRIS